MLIFISKYCPVCCLCWFSAMLPYFTLPHILFPGWDDWGSFVKICWGLEMVGFSIQDLRLNLSYIWNGTIMMFWVVLDHFISKLGSFCITKFWYHSFVNESIWGLFCVRNSQDFFLKLHLLHTNPAFLETHKSKKRGIFFLLSQSTVSPCGLRVWGVSLLLVYYLWADSFSFCYCFPHISINFSSS